MKYLTQGMMVGILCYAALFFSSCSSESQSKSIANEDSTSAVPVEISTAYSSDISARYSNTATLEALEEAMVVAKVRGIVKEIKVEEGDKVEAGDVLARLEDEQLELEARRARATMERLNNELDRKMELYQKNLISTQEFENAKYEFEAEQSAYELALLKIEQSQIKAPISGMITERLVKVGNMIHADEEVYKITSFDPLLAVLHVPEHEMNKLKKGQPALVQVDALPGKQFEGQVLRINPAVNSETGTLKVTVSIKDESRQLKPGMFGRVNIIYDTHINSLLIPKNALITEDGENRVFTIKNNVAYRTPVQTGYANGNDIEIISGLSTADTVVVTGHNSLQDSTLVEVVAF